MREAPLPLITEADEQLPPGGDSWRRGTSPATAPPLAIAAAVVGGVGPVGMSVLFSGSTGFRNARLHLHR